ncbi:hypothetical protein THAOC_22667 [Thalassiosira oceanica]|uniref:Uncharacterized protein n=1 Tax=Thalassiosira oceanica TaxID=159749 RepID=K0RXW6_THAOC|nr:hypothetical protein THAOC_22667 [Thalassiosira oceanica]|eukprot:EJK57304.1 hypothetical protein THAOC_22667 [Thalassiosira oceanica]
MQGRVSSCDEVPPVLRRRVSGDGDPVASAAPANTRTTTAASRRTSARRRNDPRTCTETDRPSCDKQPSQTRRDFTSTEKDSRRDGGRSALSTPWSGEETGGAADECEGSERRAESELLVSVISGSPRQAGKGATPGSRTGMGAAPFRTPPPPPRRPGHEIIAATQLPNQSLSNATVASDSVRCPATASPLSFRPGCTASLSGVTIENSSGCPVRAPPSSSDNPPRRPFESSRRSTSCGAGASGVPSIGRVGGTFRQALGEGPRGRALQFSGRGGIAVPGISASVWARGPGQCREAARASRHEDVLAESKRTRGRGTWSGGRGPQTTMAGRGTGLRAAVSKEEYRVPAQRPGQGSPPSASERSRVLSRGRRGARPSEEGISARLLLVGGRERLTKDPSCPRLRPYPPTGARTNSRPFAKKDQTDRPESGQRRNKRDRRDQRGRRLDGVETGRGCFKVFVNLKGSELT